MALTCQAQLGKAINKEPASHYTSNYWRELGKVTQKIFELYFNQQINLKAGGQEKEITDKVIQKIISSPVFTARQITYPMGKTEEDLKKDIIRQATNGFQYMKDMGLMNRPIRSEVKWMGTHNGFRLFGMLDFDCESSKGVSLFDGKGTKEPNSDPRQILHYALTVHAAGKKIDQAGFIYWDHGYKEVDVSPKALKAYIDGPIAEVRPIFKKLEVGTEDLPTNPSKKNCNWCNWRHTCVDSVSKRPSPTSNEAGEVTFEPSVV